MKAPSEEEGGIIAQPSNLVNREIPRALIPSDRNGTICNSEHEAAFKRPMLQGFHNRT
ncbi:MAG TPA: hypothetical protein VHF07_02365 [Nitrospiraceae bacterium]|nr:hypothetical protein [Nitrospiraceae bacterium]